MRLDEGGFAGAVFADQGEDLAGAQGEGEVAHGQRSAPG